MRQKYGFCCHLTTFYTENKGLKSNIFKKWEFAIFFYLQMSRFHYFCVILVKMETHQFEIEAKCMRPMLLNLAVRYTGSVDELRILFRRHCLNYGLCVTGWNNIVR